MENFENIVAPLGRYKVYLFLLESVPDIQPEVNALLSQYLLKHVKKRQNH
jgi:hypothetical protein